MADLSDVEVALASSVTQTLYPNGTSGLSAVGVDCRIYRGWPLPAALNNDLKNGIVNVTVFPGTDPGRLTTRYVDGQQRAEEAPGLSFLLSGNTVTFGGSAGVGQIAGLLADKQTYVYRTQVGDTPALVAANLATLARADYIVTLSGTSITIPTAGNLKARVIADSMWREEVRRQSRLFHITCWCPSAQTRDKIATTIDQAFAGMTFISLPDATFGRISYEGTTVTDRAEDVLLYRRDLMFLVEYATIVVIKQPEMLFGDLSLNSEIVVA